MQHFARLDVPARARPGSRRGAGGSRGPRHSQRAGEVSGPPCIRAKGLARLATLVVGADRSVPPAAAASVKMSEFTWFGSILLGRAGSQRPGLPCHQAGDCSCLLNNKCSLLSRGDDRRSRSGIVTTAASAISLLHSVATSRLPTLTMSLCSGLSARDEPIYSSMASAILLLVAHSSGQARTSCIGIVQQGAWS